MTLRERNLVIASLELLADLIVHADQTPNGQEVRRAAQHGIIIMKRQPLSSPGLPVSAGGDPEEPRYCVECGEPVLENHLTCGKCVLSKEWLEKRVKLKAGVEIGYAGAYPPNWPKCPSCARPALDGHITCGLAACNEDKWRDVWSHK